MEVPATVPLNWPENSRVSFASLRSDHMCRCLPRRLDTHSSTTQFNQCIGIDVKYLDGWKPGQKIKALNIVDQASCFQVMVPFHERETSSLLRELVDTHWIRWAGPPDSVVLDPAQTMLGEALQSMFESHGTVVRLIAAEAHWQLGRTENHGGWFNYCQ